MEAKQLLIYSPRDSPRLQYTLQLVFRQLLGVAYEFTIEEQQYSAFDGPKLSYGPKNPGDGVFIYADELLFTANIQPPTIHTGSFRDITTLFHHGHEAALPFDPLAAAFYLVSRYEEYLPFQGDAHGRFPAEVSLNYMLGFHQVPVVNHYALFIRQQLLHYFPEMIFPERNYQFQLTYDIDMAFAFREKGWLRNAVNLLRSAIMLNVPALATRLKVLSGFEQDPFDTFDYQQSLHDQFTIQPVYFFLLGDHSRYDKNISWKNPVLQRLVQDISGKYPTGIHASYASNRFPGKIKTEKERLEKISGRNVFRNRQHYLKLKMPVTYQRLLAAGITEDYTMGYASQTGFRAGIASAFYFYDLQNETSTDLLIHPFAAMDAALFYHLKMDASAALAQAKHLADEVKKVNGTFTFLAHNDLIGDQGPWQEWRLHFEKLIRDCSNTAQNNQGNFIPL